MTQVKRQRVSRAQVALRGRRGTPTLAQRRAQVEAQIREQVEKTMALSESELPDVSRRLKSLRTELARKRGVREVSQYALAQEVGKAPRTFQSHENGEVEPRDNSYGVYADFYSQQLGREITKNWIMFGADEPPADVQRGPAPDPFEASQNGTGPTERIEALEGEVSELRGGLVAVVELLLDQADREAEAAEKRADRGEPAAEPHSPERVRRLEEARRWAERQRRT